MEDSARVVRLPRPTWDDYFLGVARAVAARADCTRRQVGAVIVDEQRRVISTGYNGALEGDPGCLTSGACPRGRKSLDEVPAGSSYDPGGPGFCIAIHAEANAILENNRYLNTGSTMYCTENPCHNCLQMAWAAGIETIVTPEEVIHRNMRYPRVVAEEQEVSVH